MNSPNAIRNSTILATAAVLVLAHLSCTEKVTPPPVPPITGPVVMRPVTPDSVQTIFTAKCALSGCHNQAAMQAGQILDADSSFVRNVNRRSTEIPSRFRITPGDTVNSYLVMKIRGDSGIQGSPMPLGNFPLPTAEQRTIIDWVAIGAPADSVPADSSLLSPRRLSILVTSFRDEHTPAER